MERRKKIDPQLELKQQEFSKKKWVWIVDDKEGCIAAHIINEGKEGITVKLNDGNERTVTKDEIDPMNPPKYDKCEDMSELTHLNESSVLNNLRERYLSNLIYTYSGLFLVVINPWKRLPLYTEEMIKRYKGKKRRDLEPHIYAVCDEAYRTMLENRENQSLLITGESGAGKTENTKKVIQYLAHVAGNAGGSDEMSVGALEKQIILTNPLLESFGNAKTIRNNNSSRFGKFIRIEFGHTGKIVGCNIDIYLLEKARVVNHQKNERTFHIFYQLLDGATEDMKKKFLLEPNRNYKYLQGTTNIDGVDNAAEFKDTVDAMNTIGFTELEKDNMWCIISGVLLFGNLVFSGARRDDSANIDNPKEAEKLCHVLGIRSDDFTRSLLKPRIKAGREWVTAMVTKEKAYHSSFALAKTIYERLFKWIVSKINTALETTSTASFFIGCLDIAGFEIFELNSFEQLCINLTNEKLQQFFNHHMFILEQEEYVKENIEWTFVDFGLDLQPTIDLIEKPMGIMSILDEQCLFPKATDNTFVSKLHETHDKKHEKYSTVRLHPNMFSLVHYAGQVDYDTADWLEKNTDPINDNVAKLLAKSSNELVTKLFEDVVIDEEASRTSGRSKKGASFITVSQRHRTSLNSLMNTLFNTTPHFVRCIIPNEVKKAGLIDAPLVLDQLRCNGVLEGIRICRMGFPSKIPFAEFKQRYEILAVGVIPKGFMDGKVAAEKLIGALEIPKADHRIGLSKVFFKAGVIAELEEQRDFRLSHLISGFQAIAKGYIARKKFRQQHGREDAIRLVQKNARIFIQMYKWPWWKLYRQVKPLLSIHRQEQAEKALQDKIKELEAKLAEEEAKRSELDAKVSGLEKERNELSEDLEAEREALDETVASLKRIEETRNELQNLTNELEDQLDEAEGNLVNAENQKKKLKEELNETKAKLADDSEKLLAIADTKAQKDAELEELRKRYNQEKSDLEDQLDEDRKRMDHTIKTLTEEVANLKTSHEKLKKQTTQLNNENVDLAAELEGAEEAKAKHERNEKKLQHELEEAHEQNRDLSSQLSSMEDSKRSAESRVSSVKQRLDEAELGRASLEQQKKNFEEEIADLNKQLHDASGLKAKLEQRNKALQIEVEDFDEKLDEEKQLRHELEIELKAKDKEIAELKEKLAKAEDHATNTLMATIKAERTEKKLLEEKLTFESSRKLIAEEREKVAKNRAKDLDHKLREVRETLRN